MLTALLACVTSVLFGFSDFFGGLASRRESSLRITVNAQSVGLVLLALAALLVRGTPTCADLMWGVAAGFSGGFGVAALYAGLAAGRMSVVAPIAAALSGSIPATVDLARGADLSAVTLVGIALAILAVAIVGMSAEDDGPQRPAGTAAILYAIGAGIGFSGSFLSFSATAASSGLWPLVTARLMSIALVMLLALAFTRGLAVDPAVRPPMLGAAFTDAAANVTMLTAVRIGPLAIASVLGSLYPAVVVVLAFSVLGERLKRQQQFGIALALVAVVMTALP